MNDKQRAEFEKWFPKELEDKAGVKSLMWHVWQAAITSVVVELPKIYFAPYADDRTQERELGKEIMLDEVKSALDKAGIRHE